MYVKFIEYTLVLILTQQKLSISFVICVPLKHLSVHNTVTVAILNVWRS
jgi:hypothetical protein